MKCFKKDYVKPVELPPIDGEVAERNGKTGLLIGHNERDKGANNREWYFKYEEYDEEYDDFVRHYDLDGDRLLEEYELNLETAKLSGLTFATRDDGRGRRGAAEDLAEADCTEAISMHCNNYNGVANGFEFWYLDGVIESKRFAEKLHKAYKAEYPHLVDRKVKRAKKGSRPYGVLDALRDNGIRKCTLAEWYFLDVRSDFIPPEKLGAFLKKFGAQ